MFFYGVVLWLTFAVVAYGTVVSIGLSAAESAAIQQYYNNEYQLTYADDKKAVFRIEGGDYLVWSGRKSNAPESLSKARPACRSGLPMKASASRAFSPERRNSSQANTP